MKQQSIFHKILTLSVCCILLPTILLQGVSFFLLKSMSFQEAEYTIQDSLYLSTSYTESFLRALVLFSFSLSEDETIIDIAQNNAATGDTLSALEQLSFTEISNETLLAERVFFLDTNVYTTLITQNESVLTNFGTENQLQLTAILNQQSNTQNDPSALEWNFILLEDQTRNQKNWIDISKEIFSTNGFDTGAQIHISVTEAALRETIQEKGGDSSNQSTQRFIIDESGFILSCTDHTFIGTNIHDFLSYSFFTASEGFEQSVSTTQGQAMMAFCQLAVSPWTIVILKDHTFIYETLRVSQTQLITTCILFAFMFLLISSLLAKRLTIPLEQMHQQMMNISQETLLEPLIVPNGAGVEILSLYQGYQTLQTRITELLLLNQRTEQEKNEREIAALQAQIKPHFLLNSLMSVRCAISNGHPETATAMLTKLSSYFRYSIVRDGETATISQEISMIKAYVAIENLRNFQNYSIETNIPENLGSYILPKFLLQPLVENSIKHGFKNQETGNIRITATQNDSAFMISVQDDGCGFEQPPLGNSEKSTHYGVFSVNKRIQLYFGNQYHLSFQNRDGTIAQLILPLQEDSPFQKE